MKYFIILAGFLLILNPASVSGNFFSDYFKNRYPVKIVKQMPEGNGNRIIIISTRHFKTENDLVIKRGLDPRYRLTLFVAELLNDTAYILPLKELDEIKEYVPVEKDFLVMVDGHGKTFGQSVERGFELSSRFQINMIVFDWPTDYFAIRKTITNASDVTVSFVRAMRDLEEVRDNSFPDSPVSIIFHSMGNRILKEISSTRLIEKMPGRLFSNIVINAAAVKQRNHARWVEDLKIQKRIYITMNQTDFNLRGAAMLRMAVQLGMTNKKGLARNAFYVNFSDLLTIEHNFFLERSMPEKNYPEVYNFYKMAFHGKEVIPGAHAGFQILSPSDKSFLFSEK